MLTSIDLFAGCGGLTRGLEWAGFECLAFNELNKDAADSFALNFPDALRLDGDIMEAVSQEVIEETLIPLIESKGGLDLLCGGPPCQGFSGIGHRRTHKLDKRDIPTNHLFHEMIRVITALRPKVFLFENVEGILSGKWSPAGMKGEIFKDVWDGFSSISGYTVQPTLLHAYAYGVPQNRPRVMVMGIRNDILKNTSVKPTEFDINVMTTSLSSKLLNNGGFFASWDENEIKFTDPVDVLSDLDFCGWDAEKPFHQKEPETDFQKSMRVGNQYDEQGNEIVTDHQFSNHTSNVKERFEYMLKNKIYRKTDLPLHMQTRKFSQRPLPVRWEKNPTVTIMSMPDDYIHYSNPRTLSVREWARMQTFPDKHLFSGPRTTGGSRRAGNPSIGNWSRDVPKYTQIGNAVPPLLAKGIGERVKEIIQGNPKATNSNGLGKFLETLSNDDFSIESQDITPFQKAELITLFANPIFRQLLANAISQHSKEDLQDPKKVSLIVKSFKKTADIVISNSLFKLAVRVVRKFTIGA